MAETNRIRIMTLLTVFTIRLLCGSSLLAQDSKPEISENLISTGNITTASEQVSVYIKRAQETIQSVFWTQDTRYTMTPFLAAALIRAGSFEKAARTIEELQNPYDESYAWSNAAQCLVDSGDVAGASRIASLIRARYGDDDLSIFHDIAEKNLEQGNLEECHENLVHLLNTAQKDKDESDADDGTLFLSLTIALKLNKYELAQGFVDCLVLPSSKAEGYCFIAGALAKEKNYEESQKMIAKAENIIRNSQSKDRVKARDLQTLAAAWAYAQKPEKSKMILAEIELSSETIEDATGEDINRAQTISAQYYIEGVTQARKTILSIKIPAIRLMGYCNLASVQNSIGDTTGAAETRRKAYEIALILPTQVLSFHELQSFAFLLIEAGEKDKAREVLSRSRQILLELQFPQKRIQSQFLNWVARMQVKCEDYTGLEQTLKDITESENRWECLWMLAWIKAGTATPEEIEKFLQDYPDPYDKIIILLGAAIGADGEFENRRL